MSRNFTCPRCSESQKETVVPHDGFGYFVSHKAIENMEFDLGLQYGTLDAWLSGRRRPSHDGSDPLTVPPLARCYECGTIAEIDSGGHVITPKA